MLQGGVLLPVAEPCGAGGENAAGDRLDEGAGAGDAVVLAGRKGLRKHGERISGFTVCSFWSCVQSPFAVMYDSLYREQVPAHASQRTRVPRAHAFYVASVKRNDWSNKCPLVWDLLNLPVLFEL